MHDDDDDERRIGTTSFIQLTASAATRASASALKLRTSSTTPVFEGSWRCQNVVGRTFHLGSGPEAHSLFSSLACFFAGWRRVTMYATTSHDDEDDPNRAAEP